MIPITTLCIAMFAERQAQILLAKLNLSLEKKLKRKSPVYHNKTKSLKHEKCFNVVSEKPHSSTKYLLPHSGH
jgi:hypothetical protein